MEKTQEELVLENRVFIKEAFEKMGFGTTFNQPFDKGAEKGQETIEFPKPGELTFDAKKNERVEYKPNVVLNPQKEDQYLFKGYQATRFADGEKSRTHYFHVFKKTGLHAEKAHAKLNGGTVRETVIDDNKQLRTRYSKLLLDEPKTPAGNYKTANVWEKDRFETLKILNSMPLAIKPADLDDVVHRLQFGEKIRVPMRGAVPMNADIELNLKKGSKDVAIKLTNEAGQTRDYTFKQERTMKLAEGKGQSEGKGLDKGTKSMELKTDKKETKKTTTTKKLAAGIKSLVNKPAAKKAAKAKVKRA